MNHLLTFAQFLARRFSKEHKKLILIQESKHMKKCLGNCTKYRFGKMVPERLKNRTVYLVQLNIRALDNYYEPEEVRQIIMHGLVHTLAYNHGKRFKRICTHYGVGKNHLGPKMKDDNKTEVV